MIFDGFVNFVTNLGVDGKDPTSGGMYQAPMVALLQHELMYRTSPNGALVVDTLTGDETREWRAWDDEVITLIERSFCIQRAVTEWRKKARIYGTAAIYMHERGADEITLAQPFEPDSLRPGDLEFISVLSADDLSVADVDENALSPRYQKGITYTINRSGSSNQRIHYSRFVWAAGVTTPLSGIIANAGHDDSVFTRLGELIKAADSAAAALARMIPEALVDVFSIEDLPQYFANDEDTAKLLQRVATVSRMKSAVNAMVVDKEEDYTQKTVNFSGAVLVYEAARKTLASAAGVPVSRFLGEVASGGLNNSAGNDLATYYDRVRAAQTNEITHDLLPLDIALMRHAGVSGLPSYEWLPLEQMDAKQLAEINKLEAETATIYASGLFLDNDALADAVADKLGKSLYPGMTAVD